MIVAIYQNLQYFLLWNIVTAGSVLNEPVNANTFPSVQNSIKYM